jgi:protocatechuate 3,4-dioxygenase beta subunit
MNATPAIGHERAPWRVARRSLLGAALLIPGASALAQEPMTRRGTPQLTLGPFYPLARSPEEDPDLTRIAGRPRAKGQIIELSGRVLDMAGNPVAGARIDSWQTNGLGAYHHPADESGQPQDPGFQGGAIFAAGPDGAYWLRTVMPQPYGTRQRHLHFDVRGRQRRLMTQMFFPGEPNEKDSLYPTLRDPAVKARVVARQEGTPREAGAIAYRWDIILSGEAAG